MDTQGFVITERPELDNPTLIAGFDGWGNALDVAKTMAGYLIRKLSARSIGKINTDLFYRYDETRPMVRIEEGMLKSLMPPGGKLYTTRKGPGGKDLVIMRAQEPNLNWARFVDDLYGLSHTLGVNRIITLGSMYDNVLHTDRIVSGIASSPELLAMIKRKDILPISYFGPTVGSVFAGESGHEFQMPSGRRDTLAAGGVLLFERLGIPQQDQTAQEV